jgi:Na+/melibiose symporter-like transporter
MLVGFALLLALCVDAITDPVVGVWSDGLKSRLGRRHPFMYASAIPLAICYMAVFMPPGGMSQAALFLWLLTFAIGTRFSMTLFVIPHQTLVAELTSDCDERTTLQSLRVVFAWIFGLVNAALAYVVFLAAGLDQAAGYTPFAIFGATVMLVATLVSARGTQRAALEAQPEADAVKTIPLRQIFGQMLVALESPAYRATVIAGIFLFVGFGVAENLGNYIYTYFWGFTPQQIFGFILVIMVASVGVLLTARKLSARFGKRKVGMVCGLIHATAFPSLILLKFAGALPPPGSTTLLLMIGVAVYAGYSAIIMGMTMIGSMIADITDEHELRTGSRQEGLLFSANMLLDKAASGVGVFGASIVVKIANIPAGASRDTVSSQVVQNLGLLSMTIAVVFGLGMAWSFSRYRLSRERHVKIIVELENGRTFREAVNAGAA